MKKFCALFLTFIILFACTVVPAHAAENNTIMPRASQTHTGTMKGGTSAVINRFDNVGQNPKFTFSISGNNSLYVKVLIVTAPGTVTGKYLMTGIKCDGSTHTITLPNAYTGSYSLQIMVQSGSTWGDVKNYSMTVSY